MMKALLMSPLVAIACLAAAACGIAEVDWNNARAAGTLAAYQAFLIHHPDDRHAENARGRILALQDDKFWSAAMAAHTTAGFHRYLKEEPGGTHVAEAHYYLEALERASGANPNPPRPASG
jgi:hypothetical protein